jgi:hypothetical protein
MLTRFHLRRSLLSHASYKWRKHAHVPVCVYVYERKEERERDEERTNILTRGIVLIFLPCEIARALHGFSTIDKATSAPPPPLRTVFTLLLLSLARLQARPSCSGGCSSPSRCYEIGRREKIRRLRARVSIHPHGHLVCPSAP